MPRGAIHIRKMRSARVSGVRHVDSSTASGRATTMSSAVKANAGQPTAIRLSISTRPANRMKSTPMSNTCRFSLNSMMWCTET